MIASGLCKRISSNVEIVQFDYISKQRLIRAEWQLLCMIALGDRLFF